MSNIKNLIQKDFIASMKSQDKLKLSVLRMLKSAIENKEKESRQPKELDDEAIIKVIHSEIKKRAQAIGDYQKAKRNDLAHKEEQEKKILETYLPKQMSAEEISALVDKVIAQLNASSPKQIGQVIGQVMGETKGRASGELVSRLVKQKLITK